LKGFAHQGFALVPHRWPSLAEALVQRRALAVLQGNIGQYPKLSGQGPENHWWLDPFATQAFEHAQGVGGFAVEDCIHQPEYVKTCTVRHGALYRFDGNLPVFGHQLELFDLLSSGKQVALDPGGDQLNRVLRCGQPRLGQALANPLRQLIAVHRPYLDELGLRPFYQGLAPLGLLRAAVEFGQADQQDRIFSGT